MREYSTPALVDIPASAGLADVVFRRAAEEPDAVIMRRKAASGPAGGRRPGGWQDVTAGAFRDEVLPLAKGLIAAGIQPGDRVALMSRTRYEWTLIDYAIWSAGAVTVPIYETSSAEQVEWILGDSGARAVFAETAAHEAVIGSVRAQLPGLETCWRIEGEAAGGEPLRELAARSGVIEDEQAEAPPPGRDRGRPGDDHLHLGHHRPAEGLPDHPREPAGRHAQRGRGRADRGVSRPAAARRCCSSRSPTRSPASSRWPAWSRASCSATPRPSRTWCPTSPRSGRRSCSRCPGCSRRSTTPRSSRPRRARPRAGSSRPRPIRPSPTARRSTPGPAAGAGRAWPSPSGTARSTGWCTGSCAPRSAAGCSSRCPAARRSGSGSATSSAARASRSWRATA